MVISLETSSSCHPKAFTVLEMLVVVAILGILVTLVAFGVKRIRDSVDRVHCANNLHQLGIYMQLYAQEHNQRLPGPNGTQITFRTNGGIFHLLRPYAESEEVFKKLWICPANKNLIAANKSNSPFIASYIAQAKLFGYYTATDTFLPKNFLEILEMPQEERWLLMDLDSWSYAVSAPHGGDYPPVHNTGRNVLFSDGRVEYMKSAKGRLP